MGASSEGTPASLKTRALLCIAKLASTGRAKVAASPHKANSQGEAILASPTAKKSASKAKPKACQPKRDNLQSP